MTRTRWQLWTPLLLVAFLLPACLPGQTAFTAKTVNLRAGPSREYPLVMHLGPGTPVQVAGCVDDWTWCDVIVGANRGWVYAGNLVYPYQGRRVVILDNGPVIGLPVITFSIGPYWDTYYRARPWYRRRSYWIGRPPPPHWVGPPRPRPPRPRPPTIQPVPNPPPRPVRPPARPPRPGRPPGPTPRAGTP